MRSVRMLLGTVGLLVLLGGAGACGRPQAVGAGGVWIEVTPDTVEAGSSVALRADCGDNSVPATVTSAAFGTVTVRPDLNLLTAEVRVPARTEGGRYDVNLACRSGSEAMTTLTVRGRATAEPTTTRPTPQPTMGPHTGGGFLANRDRGLLAQPGIWLIGGAAALAAAGVLGAVTVRRRRRPVR